MLFWKVQLLLVISLTAKEPCLLQKHIHISEEAIQMQITTEMISSALNNSIFLVWKVKFVH